MKPAADKSSRATCAKRSHSNVKLMGTLLHPAEPRAGVARNGVDGRQAVDRRQLASRAPWARVESAVSKTEFKADPSSTISLHHVEIDVDGRRLRRELVVVGGPAPRPQNRVHPRLEGAE